MFDPNVIRLYEGGENKLNYLPWCIWTDAARKPRPETLKPFDGEVDYKIDDVIVADEKTLMFCKKKPAIGLTRPALNIDDLVDGMFVTATAYFEFKDRNFIVVAESAKSYKAEKFDGPTTNVIGTKLRIFEWTAEDATVTQVTTLNNAPLEDVIVVIEKNGRIFITGAKGQAGIIGTNRIWEFDGLTLAPFVDFPTSKTVNHCRLGTRDFIITSDDSELVRIYQLSVLTDSILEITTIPLSAGQVFVGSDTMIYQADLYLTVAALNPDGTTEVTIWRFDNTSRSFRFSSTSTIDDELTTIAFREIDREYYIVTSGLNDFINVYQFYPENSSVVFRSTLNPIFDYAGIDVDIKGIVPTFNFFIEEDKTYMNVPIYKNDDGHDCLSVTCAWDATNRSFYPFKGLPTSGAMHWNTFETEFGFYGIVAQHRNSAGTAILSKVVGWDTTIKKFSAQLTELRGGSIWNLEDWEELQISTALVTPHTVNLTYGNDNFILEAGKILRCKKIEVKGIYDPADWEEITEKQYIGTSYFYPRKTLVLGQPSWATGVFLKVHYS